MTKEHLVIVAKSSILDFLGSLDTPLIMKNLLFNVNKNCPFCQASMMKLCAKLFNATPISKMKFCKVCLTSNEEQNFF